MSSKEERHPTELLALASRAELSWLEVIRARNHVINIAMEYALVGYSVIPLLSNGRKRPPCRWTHFQNQAPPQDELRNLFNRLDDVPAIGIVCGRGSSNFACIDIDDTSIVEILLGLLSSELPTVLSKCAIYRTPSYGGHLYYRLHGDAPGNMKLAMAAPQIASESSGKVRIETRGQGGLVQVAGSPAWAHKSGRRYEHVAGFDLLSLPIAFDSASRVTYDEQKAMFDICGRFDQRTSPQPRASKTTFERPINSAGSVVANSPKTAQQKAIDVARNRPIDWFEENAAWSAILEPHGWRSPDGDVSWVRPGKGLNEGAGAKVMFSERQQMHMLFVFTTSTNDLETENYSKFRLFANLCFDGTQSEKQRGARETVRTWYLRIGKFNLNDSLRNFGSRICRAEHA